MSKSQISLLAQTVKNLPACRRLGFDPCFGMIFGDPLQRSCLENPMDKELSRLQSYGHTESDMTAVTWHTCMHSWRKDLESPRSY